MKIVTPEDGRRAFGHNPAEYETGRPGYPAELFSHLQSHCEVGLGSRVFEIGPGTGLATRGLLDLGISRLVAIEADPRLAAHLEDTLAGCDRERLSVLPHPFEEAKLSDASFELGIAATSFHWLDAERALPKVFAALVPGGWWAACWNVFTDPDVAAPFIDATQHLFLNLARTPTFANLERPPFALDRERRSQELERAGFVDVEHQIFRRSLVFDTCQVVALYRTFSQVALLPEAEKEHFTESLARIADEHFGGRITRTIMTPLYLARKPGPMDV